MPDTIKIDVSYGKRIVNQISTANGSSDERLRLLVDTLKIAFSKPRMQEIFEGLDLDEVPEFS